MKKALPLLFASAVSLGATQSDFTSGDREHILEVDLAQGGLLHNGLVAYQVGDKWYFPLTQLAQALEIYIQPLPKLTGARGFILTEGRPFELNLASCEATASGKTTTYPCSEALAFEQDIYVESSIISTWIPVDFEVEPFKSRILVSPREKLPIQARIERENRGKGQGNSADGIDLGYPRKSTDDQLFSGPTIDQQLGWRYNKSASYGKNIASYDTSLSGNVFSLDTFAHMSGSSESSGPFRLTFGKKDPNGNIGGILRLSEFQAFDVDMPSLPLVTGGSLKRGVRVSSRPLGQSSTFSTQDFLGNLPPEWEVELYQNEILVDRKTPDSSGRYAFKGIPLIYGLNQFRLAFYGPFGRRRDEYHTYQIGSNLQKAGDQTYQAALARDGTETIYTVQTDRGVTDRWTLAIGSAQLILPERAEKNSYLWLGLSGYTDSLFVNSSSAFSSKNGQAYELSARVPWRGITTGARITRLHKYHSELFNRHATLIEKIQEEVVDTNFVLPFRPAVMMNYNFTRSEASDGHRENTLGNRTATSLGPVFLNHEVSYQFETIDRPIAGRADVIYLLSADRIRTSLAYDTKSLISSELEYQGGLGNSFSVQSTLLRSFDQKYWQLSSNLSKAFPSFALLANAAYATNHEYAFGINLAVSLTRDPDQGRLRLSPESQVTNGAVSASAFIDENRNGVRDPDEKILGGAIFLTSLKSEEFVTDSHGYAHIDRLQAYQPTDISISYKSFKDPFLKSVIPGYRVVPRPGQTSSLAFPIVYVGMIDGLVQISHGGALKPARATTVELIDIDKNPKNPPQRVVTDSDGFYWFEGVAPGTYKIRIPQSDAGAREVTMPAHGKLITGKDFFLHSR